MNPAAGTLLTDLYQLTMLAAYHRDRMNGIAVFEFFVRKLPQGRNFLIAAGLEQVLDFLENLRFTAEELEWLAKSGRFGGEFVDSLANLRFSGDVHAMTEGTVFFADEPILRVTAPIQEAQLVETRIINLLQYQTMVASKAARCVLAAPGKLLVDFGLRRAHGAEAGLLSARASFLAGFGGSSNVLAGMRWDIPLFGTMAHSYVEAHDEESTAFDQFARCHPLGNTMLIDTYDTEAAARKLIPLSVRLAEDEIAIQAVRIDSGDLGAHARQVRRILDEGGLAQTKIFASGNLDEYRLRGLLAEQAPIDGFGIGTRMNTSADYPYLDCAYKLQEYAGRARRKRSEGKETWPGRKQVYRRRDRDGRFSGDWLSGADEVQAGDALLQPVMRDGRRCLPAPPLAALREHAAGQLEALPRALRVLDPVTAYPVEVSAGLRDLARAIDRRRSGQG